VVSTATGERTVWLWAGRAAACFFLIFGALVFVSFLETGTLWILGIVVAALGGALLFIFGLERPQHPAAKWALWVGWSMMAVAALVPSSLLVVQLALVLLALPILFLTPRPRTG
jgi:hypothetical protein